MFLNVIVLSNLLTGVNTLHLMRLRKTMRNGILGRPHHISSSLFSAINYLIWFNLQYANVLCVNKTPNWNSAVFND